MKKFSTFIPVVLLSLFSFTSVFPQNLKIKDKVLQESSFTYKDGTYQGISRATYKYEPFWGIVHFTLKNGLFTNINFIIRDSSLHETFNASYERHFEGNPEYIQESRNDWKGVQTYPKKLSEKQDINKVDAVSGATWSYNIFRASVNEALKNAKE